MTARQRTMALVIAVITALVLTAVPFMLNRNNERAAQTSSQSQVGDVPIGASPADGGMSTTGEVPPPRDPDGKPHSYDRQPTTGRPECPTGEPGAQVSAESPLKDLDLPCLGHGSTAGSLAEHVAGKPTLLNVWAYWCVPCRQELPLLEQMAVKHPEWNVVGVHASPQGAAGVNILLDLGLENFVSFQDADNQVATTLGMSPLIPQTIVLRADGTVAEIFPGIITDEAQFDALMAKAT